MGSTSLGYLSPTQNELTSYGATSMQYTALGLSAEISGTTKTCFIRDPSGNAVAQRCGSGTTLQGTDYFVPDNLGSTTALVTSGSVARSWSYDADGTPSSSGTGASTDILYAGGQSLSNGLTHFGARFYNPALGRWTQQDPLNQLSDLAQANRYIYAGGDPIGGSDPDGLSFLNDAYDVVKSAGKGVVVGGINGCVVGAAAGVAAGGVGAAAGCFGGAEVGAATGAAIVGGSEAERKLGHDREADEIEGAGGALDAIDEFEELCEAHC
jgi:RHS repeat-associated protein